MTPANIEFNRNAQRVTETAVLNRVAKAFGMFWWFFGLLSIWATYFTLKEVLNHFSVEHAIILTMVALGIAIIWEVFKYFAAEWVFAEQELSTKITSIVVLVFLVLGSMLFHYYGATQRTSDKAKTEVKDEVGYQRSLEEKRLGIQSQLLNNNRDLTPVLNNGTSRDDAETVRTMNMTLNLVSQLEEKQNDTIGSNEILAIYKKDNDIQEQGIMFAQIIAELFLLFGLLSKFIYVANKDDSLSDYHEAKEALMEYLYQAKEATTSNLIREAMGELELNKGDNSKINSILSNIDKVRNKPTPSQEVVQKEPMQLELKENNPPALYEQDEYKEPKPLPHQTLIDAFKNEVELEQSRELLPSVVEKEEPCHADIVDDIEEEQNEPKVKKVRALDYSNLDYEKQTCIKLMFRYGDIEAGDELMLQSEVKKKLKDKGFKRIDALVNVVYGRLKDDGFISATGERNRYVAKAELPKVFWMEKEAS